MKDKKFLISYYNMNFFPKFNCIGHYVIFFFLKYAHKVGIFKIMFTVEAVKIEAIIGAKMGDRQ